MKVTYRPLHPNDTRAIVQLHERATEQDSTLYRISVDSWKSFILRPENKGGLDFRVAEINGQIIAVMNSSLRQEKSEEVRHFRIVVEPEWRRQGVGTSFIQELLAMDTGKKGLQFQCICPENWLSGRKFLERYGFEIVESEFSMHLALSNGLQAKHIEGIGFRVIEQVERFAGRIAELHNEAYKDSRGFVQQSELSITNSLSDAVCYFGAFVEDFLIGYCHCERGKHMTWIESVVVATEYRGRGIAGVLLTAALNFENSCGSKSFELQVSGKNVAAIRVYEKLGFEVIGVSHRFRANWMTIAGSLDKENA